MSPIRDAIRLLREASEYAPTWSQTTPLLDAADALERLVTDPSAEELERLEDAFWNQGIAKDWKGEGRGIHAGVRAVLKALGSEQP